MTVALDSKLSRILELCALEGVEVSILDENLELSFDDDISDELLALLKEQKEELKKYLVLTQESDSVDDHLVISPAVLNNDGFKLSYAQERLWLLDKVEDGIANYNMTTAIRIDGGFDQEIAEQAISEIIQRHEPLRTTFFEKNGEPLQTIKNDFKFQIERHDLSDVDKVMQAGIADELVKRDAYSAFDLSSDLMVRASYILLDVSSDIQSGILIFNVHHIASDGWSMGILVSEFIKQYQAITLGLPMELKPLPIRYVDYAAWQRRFKQSGELDSQLNYWSEKLDGVQPVHSLPLDHARPQVKAQTGGLVSASMSTELLQKIESLAKNNKVTLFMVLHAALGLVIARHSNCDDIVIGTPVANRTRVDLEPLIGFFVNTLALRTKVTSQSFSDYLSQVREVNLQAQANQDVLLEHLVDHLSIPQSLQYVRLTQIVFSMNTSEEVDLSIPSLTFSNYESDLEPGAKFDLEISAKRNKSGMVISWVYDKSIFDQGSVELMSEHLISTLTAATQFPEGNILDIPMLSDAEMHELTYSLNDIQGDFYQSQSIETFFENHALRTPDALALVHERTEYSYVEVNQRANRLANHLRRLGVTSGDLVGVHLIASPEVVIAILAILKAGGAYLPLDSNYPKERIDYMLNDSGVCYLVSNHELISRLNPVGSVKIVEYDIKADSQSFEHYSESNLSFSDKTDSKRPAYVIYTSGSTGQPKGVTVSHGNWCSFLAATQVSYSLTPKDRILQFSSISFDIFVEELTLSIFNGGCLVFDGSEQLANGVDFWRSIRDNRISVISLPTAYWHQLSVDPNLHTDSLDTPLRLVIAGGEAMAWQNVVQWQRGIDRNVRLINTYGPTETTVVATSYEVEASDLACNIVPIGKRFANSYLMVMGVHDRVVPKGTLGELCVGGLSVSRGYANNPELSDQCFIPNPYSNNLDDVLYKTGDLVRILSDGNLEFVGRKDEQVKIRGFRVELGEIESRLNQSHAVESSLVVTKKDKAQQNLLVAYLILNSVSDDDGQQINQIREELKSSLPDYMIPSSYTIVNHWPLTTSGKIDQNALPEPTRLIPQDYLAADNDVERDLVLIWADLLDLDADHLSVADNFFDLGGHSLLVVKLTAAMRDQFGLEVPVKDVFEFPDIRRLANRIRENIDRPTVPKIVPIERSGNEFPLSFAQQRLWFIDRFDGESAKYNLPIVLRIDGDFCAETAEQAISKIVERHESLRTVFNEQAGKVVQIIHDEFDFSLTRHNLCEMDTATQEVNVKFLANEDVRKTFDLTCDLMVRASCIFLSEGVDKKSVLLLNMHHIASDGWSVSVFIQELLDHYKAIRNGSEPDLPPLAIQYADYAQWQRDWITGDVLHSQLAYWENQLSELPAVHNLPLDFPRETLSSEQSGGFITTLIPPEMSDRLHEVAKANRVTPFMLLHGLLALVLSRHSGSEDIVIGTPVANRSQTELEPLIGFFANTIVLRVDTNHHNLSEFLSHVKQVNVDAQAHQDIPFDYLVEHCKVPRSTTHTPVFQILFTMNTNEDVSLECDDLVFSAVKSVDIVTKFELEITADVNERGIFISWLYDKSIFSLDNVTRLSEHLESLLISVADLDEENTHIRDLQMLSSQEYDYLVNDLNATSITFPQDQLIHEIFESQVKKHPDRIAVEYCSESLTYQELNDASNQLAHYLREQGVSAETLVGICVDRSVQTVISILAVLKAGGAYVPLDPLYPAARLEFIIEDTQLVHLITQSDLIQRVNLPPNIELIQLTSAFHKELAQRYSTDNPARFDFQSDTSLAYVIYTSGSTGSPKGVMIEHKSSVSMLNWASTVYDEAVLKRVLASTSICFDISIFELFLPLSIGGSVVVVDSILNLNDSDLDVSLINTVPSAVQALLDTGGVPSSVKTVNLAGELLEQSVVDRLYEGGVERVFDLYGPSEDTTYSTYVLREKGGRNSIGRPIANTTAYILGPHLELLPNGVIGELCLGGEGVSRGYLHRPDLTNDRFIQNPFCEKPHERLYKTGDLARYLDDGNIEYLGRSDDQLKIRGFRIELGEIKGNINASALVSSCVVIANTDAQGQKSIIAYVIPESKNDIDANQPSLANDLLAELRSTLPEYMLPSRVVVMQEWPLTANGKIDKNRLPESEVNEFLDEFVLPTTETQIMLANVWADLLKVDIQKISATSNFFALGGHSLLAVRLLSILNRVSAKDLSLKQLFLNPSLDLLAKFIDQNAPSLLPQNRYIPIVDKEKDIEASAQQLRLWLLEKLTEEDAGAYNISQNYSINGELSLSAIEATFSKIVERHEVFRTNFKMEDNRLLQIVSPETEVSVSYEDLTGGDDLERKSKLEERIKEESRYSFDLANDMMLRVSIFKLGDARHFMSITIHHIAGDGWSLNILNDEFALLHKSLSEGTSDELPKPRVQYRDYSAWQHGFFDSSNELYREMSEYWTSQLTELPLCHDLPLDRPRPTTQSFRGGVHQQIISPALTEKLKHFSLENSATLFMTLQTAFASYLSRRSNSRDIIVGVPVSNRNHPDIEGLVGCFMNTVLLRTQFEESMSFDRLLQESKKTILDAFDNQAMPFELLVESLKPERNTSFNPLFQIMFVLHQDESNSLEIPGLSIEPESTVAESSKFDLTLDVVDAGSQLMTQWEYNSEIFDLASVEKMAINFVVFLEGLISDPQKDIYSIPVLQNIERDFLLKDLNETARKTNFERSIHERFECIVAEMPDQTALIDGDELISYGALDEKSNRLANYLIGQGLQPHTRVGVLAEHGSKLLVSLLAVLKAGCNYLPLDASAPTSRLEKIISQSTVEWLLSDIGHGFTALNSVDLRNVDTSIESHESPQVQVASDDLAYTIFTSGSTGEPKGVEIQHSSLTNFLVSMSETPGITPDDRVLSVTPLTFDISGLELFLPLITGATIVLGGTYVSKDGVLLGDLLDKHDITIMQATPTMWQILIESGWAGKRNLKVLTGGEAISTQLATELVAKAGEVWNMYGPTETTIWSTCGRLNTSAQATELVQITIGKPINNTQIYILNHKLEPVPIGVPGQIFIGGHGLAKGYSGRSDLTDASFVANPYVTDFGSERLYATGDLAKYLPSGEITHLGRLDHQIKLNGFRIEPAEIESALNKYNLVGDSLVVMHTEQGPSSESRQELVAYYTSAVLDSGEISNSQLRNHLLQFLPQHMIPTKFVSLAEFPINASGKRDRLHLPKPKTNRQQIESKFVAPSNELENFIIGNLVQSLNIEKLGVNDNFFEIGVTSMDVVRMSGALSDELGFRVSAIDVFTYTTTKTLADYLKSRDSSFTQRPSRKKQISKAKNRLKSRARAKRDKNDAGK